MEMLRTIYRPTGTVGTSDFLLKDKISGAYAIFHKQFLVWGEKESILSVIKRFTFSNSLNIS